MNIKRAICIIPSRLIYIEELDSKQVLEAITVTGKAKVNMSL
jgi:hypothetical protein